MFLVFGLMLAVDLFDSLGRVHPLLVLMPLAIAAGLAVLSIYVWSLLRHRRRLRLKTLGELLMLSPTQFEIAVADLLRHLGYRNVKHVGGSGDLAVAILLLI
jgi:hypothetical protein